VALVDRKGAFQTLSLPAGPYGQVRVSPDSKRLAIVTNDPKEDFISLYELAGTTGPSRLTFGGSSRFPVWSRDGRRVTFLSERDGDSAIFSQLADGTGLPERLTTPEKGKTHLPLSWSPNDETLLFSEIPSSGPASGVSSLWTFSRESRKAAPFGGVQTSTLIGAVFSPDGRWVAYSSGEAGRVTVYVQPFPATGAKYQLSPKNNEQPHHQVWSPDGKELFYNARPNGFDVVSVTTQPTFAFGNPTAVPAPFQTGPVASVRSFDITPDGGFVGLVTPGVTAGDPAQEIQVVVNWHEELKRRLPTR
jgi:Tol biopolymer transport system component